jgi:hypothetical protein
MIELVLAAAVLLMAVGLVVPRVRQRRTDSNYRMVKLSPLGTGERVKELTAQRERLRGLQVEAVAAFREALKKGLPTEPAKRDKSNEAPE